MSFDILREWDLESFDPGLEFFPETERATSLEVVEPASENITPVTAEIEIPAADEMAREAASFTNQNFASDMVANQGNHDFDLDFDVTEDMMAMWESESAARAQEDRDDLERERAGVGRKHERFGVERTDGAGGRLSNARQAADMIADMQQMQTNQRIFDNIMLDADDAIDSYDEQIVALNALIERLRLEREQMLNDTIRLADGTYVFETDDGTLVDENGNTLSDDQRAEASARIADGEKVEDSEDFQANLADADVAVRQRDEYQAERDAWAQLQEDIRNGNISPEDATTRRDELLATMPEEVRAKVILEEERNASTDYSAETVTQAEAGFSFNYEAPAQHASFSDSINFGAIETNVELRNSFEMAVYDQQPADNTEQENNADYNNQSTITTMSIDFG